MNKLRTLVLLCALLPCAALFAQQPASNAALLNEVIALIRDPHTKPGTREALAAKAAHLAKEINTPDAKGKALACQAYTLFATARLSAAWQQYEHAKTELAKAWDYNSICDVLYDQSQMLLILQQPDSLLRLLDAGKTAGHFATDENKKWKLRVLYARALAMSGQTRQAARLYSTLLTVIPQRQDTLQLFDLYIGMGELPPTFDTAVYWYRKALELPAERFPAAHTLALISMGKLFSNQDGALRDSALFYFRSAEARTDIVLPAPYLIRLYNFTGGYLYSKFEYKISASYFRKGLALAREEGQLKNILRNNLALCYTRLHQFDSASYYLAQLESTLRRNSVSDYERLLYYQTRALYRKNTGDTCGILVLSDQNEALSYAAKLNNTRIGLELLLEISDCLKRLPATPHTEKAGRQALHYFAHFYEPIKQKQQWLDMFFFLEGYGLLEAKFGSKEKAIELYQESAGVMSKIYDTDYLAGMDEAMVRYKSELKDAEITLLNQKEQAAQVRAVFVIAGLVLVTCVLILIYILYRRETKSRHLLDERNHKVEQLLREVHHRVKNNLQIVSSFINIQLDKVKDQEATRALRDTSARIMALAGLHQSLYRQDDLSRIQLDEYIAELCAGISAFSEGVKLRSEAESLSLPIDQAIPIGLAVNELITNAIKHAFVGREPGEVLVSLRQSDSRWELVVRDNGKGISAGLDPEQLPSIGIRLVKDMAENQLNGSLSFFNDGGAVFMIRFVAAG